MEDQEGKSKPSFRWIWLLGILVVLGIVYTISKKDDSSPRDSAPGLDSTGMAADTANAGSRGLAANGPDWKKVDFKSPASADAGISDKEIRVSGNKDYTIYKIPESLLFVPDQTLMQKGAITKLEQVASSINKRYQSPSLAVFSDGDSSVALSDKSKQLGIDRAIAIKDWLLKNDHFAEGSVTIQSRGQANRVVTTGSSSKSQSPPEVVVVAYRKGTNVPGK